MSLNTSLPQRLIAFALLSPSKIYGFDDGIHLEMLIGSEAILRKASPERVRQLVQLDKQMETGQFTNANITLKEIEVIKKVLKKKLKNIYHLRVEYPE